MMPPDQATGDQGQGVAPPQGSNPQTGNNGETGAENGKQRARGSSVLKQRFLANASFAELYSQAYQNLYQELIASGYAQQALETIANNAAEAGDTTATDVQTKLSQQISSISAATPQIQTGTQGTMGGQNENPAAGAEKQAQQAAESV